MIRSSGNDRMRLTELCRPMHMQQPTVTELVKRAKEAKLVTRLPSPDDRRASLLPLTANGLMVLLWRFRAFARHGPN
jgi:DNA-binding MarR family transcriptional regulator